MKNLKFRIWDKEENKFFEPIYDASNGNLLDLTITLSGELIRRTLEHCAEHQSIFPDKYLISQCTGLKDKFGKDIYEGDILNFGNNNYAEVVFENGCFSVFGEPLGWDFDSDEHPIKSNPKYCEVVGNIYENAKLFA